MENAFNYVTDMHPKMQGGDSRYNRHAQAQMFREANPDLELEAKTKKVTDKLSESMNIIANEPSLAFFRIQEHVRKCLPQLAETKHEVQELQQQVQGASFDTEYAANAVKGMHKSTGHFQNVQDLLKNAMFMKQQIDYEESRRKKDNKQAETSKTTVKEKSDKSVETLENIARDTGTISPEEVSDGEVNEAINESSTSKHTE